MTDPARIFRYNTLPATSGPVVYWMQRDQRVADNWAWIYALEQALKMNQPLVVVFCLLPEFSGAQQRHFDFMIRGLEETSRTLSDLKVPFYLLRGDPVEQIPPFLDQFRAGMLVTDFNPLKFVIRWKQRIAGQIRVAFHEVDAHNIIPCRFISDKAEYSAFTLRKKVEKLLPRFLVPYPGAVPTELPQRLPALEPGDETQYFSGFPETFANQSTGAGPIRFKPGEREARQCMTRFIETKLAGYDTRRNRPEIDGQSDLSPYLHFGHLAPQRLALGVQKADDGKGSAASFLEELIVRRELSDNFCLYNPDYDNINGFQRWARVTLDNHRNDTREFHYTPEQFEQALTHDDLWNTAQREMVITGKMHGYLRMYWAKKILEWTGSPDEACEIARCLNDKYEFDGRDPNGYAGIAWAIGGIHDRPWKERPVFGMIRYMNYQGCKRKFDVEAYVRKIKAL